jgi:hypothetical protein
MHATKIHDTAFRRTRPGLLLFAAAIGALVAVACDEGSDCTPGTEACVCTSNGGCLPHLECISDYCVDPDWTPPAADADGDEGGDDEGIAEGASASADDDGDDDEGGDDAGMHDNVGACKAWIANYDCGGFDIGQSLNCDLYADTACDISDYFDCLSDNTSCTNGFPDTSGWADCIDLAMCG